MNKTLIYACTALLFAGLMFAIPAQAHDGEGASTTIIHMTKDALYQPR